MLAVLRFFDRTILDDVLALFMVIVIGTRSALHSGRLGRVGLRSDYVFIPSAAAVGWMLSCDARALLYLWLPLQAHLRTHGTFSRIPTYITHLAAPG